LLTEADLEKIMADAKEPLSRDGRGTLVTVAAIKKLMADAKEPLIRARAKIELAGLEEEIAAAKEERQAKKGTLSGDYTDTGVVSFNNGLTKSIKDLLLPGYKAIFESTKESISAHSVNIETYKTMQLDVMRRIADLKAEIKELIQKSADFYGNPQSDINDDITSKYYELANLESLLNKVSEGITKEVLAKAEAEAKRMSLGLVAARFNDEIPAPRKPTSSKRTVIASEVLTLYSKIEKLEKREKVLTTDPDILGAEILALMEEGKEVPSDKIKTLKLLAMGSSIEMLEEEPMREDIKVPMRETVASLTPLQSLNATMLLASSKSSEYTKSEIIRMAAAVAYYIRVLNEAKLLKEKVETLKGNETNHPKTAEFRRNIFDIDETIKEIEKTIEKYTNFLNNQIFYFNGLLSDQASFYYKVGDLAVRMSQAELNSTTPAKEDSITEALKNIAAKIPILDSCYPAPFIEGFKKEDFYEDPAKTSILRDLKGEQYSKAPEKAKAPEAEITSPEALEVADLSKIDPNSEIPVSVMPEAKKEPEVALELEKPLDSSTETNPNSFSLMPDTFDNLGETLPDPEATIKEPENKPVEKTPIAQVIEASPMPVKEEPKAVPMSVIERKNEVKTETPVSPDPKVVKAYRVNVPKMRDLIGRGLEFLSKAEGMKRLWK